MKPLSKIIWSLFILTALFLPAYQSEAIQDIPNYKMLQPIPNTQNVSGGETPNAVEYLQRVYYFALTAAVILAILMLVIAGVEYTAAGVSPSAKEDAKKRIMYALGGLLLALLSWLILNTINP